MAIMPGRITASMVSRALFDLDFDQRGKHITIERVATYLRAEPEDVRRGCLELRRSRVIRDVQRAGERVWIPWAGQR